MKISTTNVYVEMPEILCTSGNIYSLARQHKLRKYDVKREDGRIIISGKHLLSEITIWIKFREPTEKEIKWAKENGVIKQ